MPESLQLNLDVSALMNAMQSRLQATTNRVIVGLAALAHLPDSDDLVPHTDASMHTTIGESPRSTPASREDCRAWLTAMGLREGVDGLSFLCEEIWRIASIATRFANGPITLTSPLKVGELDLVAIADLVHGKPFKGIDEEGLSGKLDKLRKEFGIGVAWQDELESINQARNCLTHRLGIVGEKDLKNPKYLVDQAFIVRFRAFQLCITSPDGITEPVTFGKIIAGESILSLQLGVKHAKSFRRGERIVFTAQEFMHLMMTFFGAGKELVDQASRKISSLLPKSSPPFNQERL